MFAVVTGGSGSRKSAFAEEKVTGLGAGRRIYIATMMCFDEESKKRVERHRRMRAGKGFETIECYTWLPMSCSRRKEPGSRLWAGFWRDSATSGHRFGTWLW